MKKQFTHCYSLTLALLFGWSLSLQGAAPAAGLPDWITDAFTSVRFDAQGLAIQFKAQGGRFQCLIEEGTKQETSLSEYGSTVEVPYGGAILLRAKNVSLGIRSAPIDAALALDTPPVALCGLTGADRRRLSFIRAAYVFVATEDARSFGKGLTERRAFVVPVHSLSATEVQAVVEAIQQRFTGSVVHRGDYVISECLKSQE